MFYCSKHIKAKIKLKTAEDINFISYNMGSVNNLDIWELF